MGQNAADPQRVVAEGEARRSVDGGNVTRVGGPLDDERFPRLL